MWGAVTEEQENAAFMKMAHDAIHEGLAVENRTLRERLSKYETLDTPFSYADDPLEKLGHQYAALLLRCQRAEWDLRNARAVIAELRGPVERIREDLVEQLRGAFESFLADL